MGTIVSVHAVRGRPRRRTVSGAFRTCKTKLKIPILGRLYPTAGNVSKQQQKTDWKRPRLHYSEEGIMQETRDMKSNTPHGFLPGGAEKNC